MEGITGQEGVEEGGGKGAAKARPGRSCKSANSGEARESSVARMRMMDKSRVMYTSGVIHNF